MGEFDSEPSVDDKPKAIKQRESGKTEGNDDLPPVGANADLQSS